tara:strand:- start:1820 stop:1957 length:138 start_codon:yes stop_codon:yes gene_type:complete
MDSCCTRERKKKDYLFLPLAVLGCVVSLGVLLGIEMLVLTSLGII